MPLRTRLLSLALCLGLVLPFLDKPVHIDDANFLVLARGAAEDPWRPHAIEINWQGVTQPAFEVLSNPPGLAWWLAPLHDAPTPLLHLAMLPWLLLTLWGAGQLGRALVGDERGAMLMLGTAPIVVWAAQSLTPDMPLLACTVAGVGGFLTSERRAWAWALLAGCAALFRYSGLCLVPLLLFAGLQRGRLRAALFSLAPIGALALHDLHAYGQVHLLAMGEFQSVANTPREVARKAAAALAMLGGVGLLPLLSVRPRAAVGGLGGLLLGGLGAWMSGHEGGQLVATVGFTGAGGLALGLLRLRAPQDRLLAAWTLGGLAFLLTLRFTAARYWLPFLPGPVLAALRTRPTGPMLAVAVVANTLLALGIAVDDRAFARAQHEAARLVHAQARALAPDGARSFAGHWGWQHALEALGWTPLEEDGAPAQLHAVAQAPWPQEADPAICLEAVWSAELPDTWWGPRVHSAHGAANLHAHLVAGQPPTETYAPWTLDDEPYDRVTLMTRCGGTAP